MKLSPGLTNRSPGDSFCGSAGHLRMLNCWHYDLLNLLEILFFVRTCASSAAPV